MSDLIKEIEINLPYIDTEYAGLLYRAKAEIQRLSAAGEPVLYFFSGKEGSFYHTDMAEGEKILYFLEVDTDDWTVTELPAPPSVDALIAEIDGLGLHDTYVNYKDIRTILDKYRSAK